MVNLAVAQKHPFERSQRKQSSPQHSSINNEKRSRFWQNQSKSRITHCRSEQPEVQDVYQTLTSFSWTSSQDESNAVRPKSPSYTVQQFAISVHLLRLRRGRGKLGEGRKWDHYPWDIPYYHWFVYGKVINQQNSYIFSNNASSTGSC